MRKLFSRRMGAILQNCSFCDSI